MKNNLETGFNNTSMNNDHVSGYLLLFLVKQADELLKTQVSIYSLSESEPHPSVRS